MGSMQDLRVLVTGGAGFIGSHLVDRLVGMGSDVAVLDDFSAGRAENIPRNVSAAKGDVSDYDVVKSALKDKELVFHLAAIATTKESSMGWSDPVRDYQVNTLGTLNVLRALSDSHSEARMVYASSAAVYGPPQYVPMDEAHPTNPVSPYGVSKLAGEKYSQAFHQEKGLRTTSIRIFNTYGSRQPRYVMHDLMTRIMKNPSRLEVMGTGKQIRDFIHVNDTVRAFVLAAQNPRTVGGIYNVGGGSPIELKDLVDKMVSLFAKGSKTAVSYTGTTWVGDIATLHADITRIKEDLGFVPEVKLEQGLRELWDWMQRTR